MTELHLTVRLQNSSFNNINIYTPHNTSLQALFHERHLTERSDDYATISKLKQKRRNFTTETIQLDHQMPNENLQTELTPLLHKKEIKLGSRRRRLEPM